MRETIVADWIGTNKTGYWVGAFISLKNQAAIKELDTYLSRKLPGLFWFTPLNELHITLFEVIMTLREYGEDKDLLYQRCSQPIESELKKLLSEHKEIKINFNKIEASKDGVIVRGEDDGSFNKIRSEISAKHLLPKITRTPPDIVHSSIARYLKVIDLDKVNNILSGYSLVMDEIVSRIQLVRISRPPMTYSVVNSFHLERSAKK